MAGGAISNCEFNDAEDRLYVAHAINSEGRITTYTRSVTTGGADAARDAGRGPGHPPGTGGAGGAGGAGGTGGAPITLANTQTLTFDRDRHFLVAPNYNAGNVYVYAVATDGSVGSLVSSRADGNNAHHAVFTLNNNFVMVPYLGSNQISVYGFNAAHRRADAVEHRLAARHDRAAPHRPAPERDVAVFDQRDLRGRRVGAGTIDLFSVNQTTGAVAFVATTNVPLPTGYTGVKNGAEIDIAPAGDLLFVSMRLDNVAMGSLVSYMVNPTTGALTLIEQESSRGAQPRHFSLSKDRRLLVVGNQASNTIAVFGVDPAGAMTFIADRDVCLSPRFARMAIDQ